MEFLTGSYWPGWTGTLEIVFLALCFYLVFMFFRETMSAQVLSGLVLLLVVMIGLTQLFRMDALNWLLRQLSVYLAIGLVIIFQPEIRRALAEIGKQHVFAPPSEPRATVDDVVQAVMLLAGQRVGALIAIEREIGTGAVQETGVRIDSRVSPELLASIFYPHTPLHDGGVIIKDNRIVAAGCVFPVSQRAEGSKGLGTRHRAAMGITEETDAVVVVVSEETGAISVCYRGKLVRGLDDTRLRRFLSAMLLKGTRQSSWFRARERLNSARQSVAKLVNIGEPEEEDRDAR
jgi:diadenylate cyclase